MVDAHGPLAYRCRDRCYGGFSPIKKLLTVSTGSHGSQFVCLCQLHFFALTRFGSFPRRAEINFTRCCCVQVLQCFIFVLLECFTKALVSIFRLGTDAACLGDTIQPQNGSFVFVHLVFGLPYHFWFCRPWSLLMQPCCRCKLCLVSVTAMCQMYFTCCLSLPLLINVWLLESHAISVFLADCVQSVPCSGNWM